MVHSSNHPPAAQLHEGKRREDSETHMDAMTWVKAAATSEQMERRLHYANYLSLMALLSTPAVKGEVVR